MKNLPTRYWYDDSLQRGDKVILHLGKNADFYKNCQATFITSVATSKDNEAFVLLENCDISKTAYGQRVLGDTFTEVFSLELLEKINK